MTQEGQTLPLDVPAPPDTKEAPTRIVGSSPGCTLKRPKESDQAIVRAAAERLAARCVKWDPTSKAEDWVEDLIKASHHWDDGYKLVKYLDDHAHVEGDVLLVEELDGAGFELSRLVTEETRRWVAIVGFDPAFAVGDKVSCRHGEGVVNSIRVETAQYVVATDGRETGGYIINAEDLKAV